MQRQAEMNPWRARILCAISFHFVRARLEFLSEVLRSLAEFDVLTIDVNIFTNTTDAVELFLLQRLCSEILSGSHAEIRSFGTLEHPYDLTWCHKPIISKKFLDDRLGYTHFIYLEDDIRLTFANFCYFDELRGRLLSTGLIPSFVRVEWSGALGGFVASDAFWPVYIPAQTHLALGDTVMVNMPNPYNPCFILDTELAKEYVCSPSFDRAASRDVAAWGIRERAAMGLCLENVPRPFQTRYVVPVEMHSGMVPARARISHLPNTYANDPRMPLGKVRLVELFHGAKELKQGRWWPSPPCPGSVDESRAASAENGDRASIAFSEDLYYLVTHHDTVIYLDRAAQRLRHGPFGVVPVNLVVGLAEAAADLVVLGEPGLGRARLAFASPGGDTRSLSEGDVEHCPDGSVGLRAAGLYVGAEMNGDVRGDKPWCRQYEQFRLVRADTIAGFAILQQHSWISDDDGRPVAFAPQPIDFGLAVPHESSALAATIVPQALSLRRELVFGAARLRIVGRERRFDWSLAAGDSDRLHVWITDCNGRQHGFMSTDGSPA
jgi:hypothetical protein